MRRGRAGKQLGAQRPLAYIPSDDHAPLMPTVKENSSPYTEADQFGFVLTGLFGVIDDAEASHCNPAGITLLRQAAEILWAEFMQRHPGAWVEKQTGG